MGLLLEDKAHRYVKYSMYVLNFLIGLLGLALTGLGIWIRIDFNVQEYQKRLMPIFDLCGGSSAVEKFELSLHIDTIAYFLIFLGVAILGMSMVGISGAMGEKQMRLGMFCILLFIIFAILMTAGVHSVNYKDTFRDCEGAVNVRLVKSVNSYFYNDTSRLFMNSLQAELSCCGADGGYTDYNVTNTTTTSELNNGCQEQFYFTACDRVIREFFEAIADNMIMIVVVSFSIGIFTIAGMGMSAFLFLSLRKAKAQLWTEEMKATRQSSTRKM